MTRIKDETTYGHSSRLDDGRGRRLRRPIKTRTMVLVGLAVFTLAPAAWVLQIGKGAWQGKLLGAAILGTAGAVAFIMLYGLMRVLLNALKGPPTVPLQQGEQVVHIAPANHYLGLASHGGELRITTDRLLFLPHRFNFTLKPVIIRWAEVDGIAFDETIDFLLLQAAVAAVAHMHTGSKLLRVRHGFRESRFVVFLTPALVKAVTAAAAAAHPTQPVS